MIKAGIGVKNYEDIDAIVIMINFAMDLRECFQVEKFDVIWCNLFNDNYLFLFWINHRIVLEINNTRYPGIAFRITVNICLWPVNARNWYCFNFISRFVIYLIHNDCSHEWITPSEITTIIALLIQYELQNVKGFRLSK